LLEYGIRRVHVNLNGLKLNGTHQCLLYDDSICILGGSLHTVKANTEAFVVASEEFGLPVNSDKAKYMVMSRDENAGRSRHIKFDNISFERVKELKCFGTTLTNKNSVEEEIRRRLKSGNAYYHSVQDLLFSNLLSKNIKIKIYRNEISLVVLYGCETW
jgi:hypothetical protein